LTELEEQLIKVAKRAKEKAYAPYSGLRVGAALKCKDGKIFSGSNVENAVYGLSLCAERVVAVKAISEGCSDFEEIVIVSDSEEPLMPCGSCRQFLLEFNPELKVLLVGDETVVKRRLSDLMPEAFSGQVLRKRT
jgi:cytidine deaminase